MYDCLTSIFFLESIPLDVDVPEFKEDKEYNLILFKEEGKYRVLNFKVCITLSLPEVKNLLRLA